MNDTNRTAKNLLSINGTAGCKIDHVTPQQASKMQCPLFLAAFTWKVASKNEKDF